MPIPNEYQQIATRAQVVVICHGEPGKSWRKILCANSTRQNTPQTLDLNHGNRVA
jgi:hypothetical protein